MISEVAELSPNSVNKTKLKQINNQLLDSDDSDCDEYIINNSTVTFPSDNNGQVQEINSPPSFGKISVINSNDVHFGNKTFYQGPVTIKQFLLPGNEIQGESSLPKICENGVNNVNGTIKNEEENKISVEENPSGGFKYLLQFSRKHLFLLSRLIVILAVLLLILTIVLLLSHDSDEEKNGGHQNTSLAENVTFPEKIRIESRWDWIAQPPANPLEPLPIPVPYVVIHHTATESCVEQSKCRLQVRLIQDYNIESLNLRDIMYNFLIGGDGDAYEGRGWQFEGAHTFNYNTRSLGIAFIGTFTNSKPMEQQIIVCKKLIAMGIEKGFIRENYKLFGARQLDSGTKSPGNALFEEIKTWDHWVQET